jgi:hypothetical protein
MDIKEKDKIINKAISVIDSCKTQDQLHVAVRYTSLCFKRINWTIGDLSNVERHVGYAQCNIDNEPLDSDLIFTKKQAE